MGVDDELGSIFSHLHEPEEERQLALGRQGGLWLVHEVDAGTAVVRHPREEALTVGLHMERALDLAPVNLKSANKQVVEHNLSLLIFLNESNHL